MSKEISLLLVIVGFETMMLPIIFLVIQAMEKRQKEYWSENAPEYKKEMESLLDTGNVFSKIK